MAIAGVFIAKAAINKIAKTHIECKLKARAKGYTEKPMPITVAPKM
jgi:hypothetical protein